MKLKLILMTIITAFSCIPVSAAITPQEATSADYLESHGHSGALVEMVQQSKAGYNGEVYVTQDELKHANDSAFVKFVRRIFIYLDPALDNEPLLKHETKMTPSIDDL